MIPNDIPTPDDFTHEIGALEWEASEFDGVEITHENAPAVRDVIARATALAKRIEDARKTAKQPHLDAGREVDASFKPPLEKVSGIGALAKKILTPYLAAEQERQRAEAEAARKLAEEAAKADSENAAKAEAAAREAERKAQDAGRVASKSGLARAVSLRTVRRAVVTDAKALVAHYAAHPAVIEAAEKLANADIRAAKGAAVEIPGISIEEEKVVA